MKEKIYNFKEFESKWIDFYSQVFNKKTHKVDLNKDKYYILDMFSYPSGAGLHVGHTLGYVATDVVARYKRMCGMNVFHPMGFDTFGLPAERYAFANNLAPEVAVNNNIKNFLKELKTLALLHNDSSYLRTSDPAFYKWTQWCFIQFFNHWYNPKNKKAEKIESFIEEYGKSKYNLLDENEQAKLLNSVRLAYLDYDEVNWCEKLHCILANEELDNEGNSIVGGYRVTKKKLLQWKLRITAYADRLLETLPSLNWPEGTLKAQKNWIGKKEIFFLKLLFNKEDSKYILIELEKPNQLDSLSCILLQEKEEIKKIYCPALDRYIKVQHSDKNKLLYSEGEDNSAKKIDSEKEDKIIKNCVANGTIVKKTKYLLRDWVFSRQRYWGEPIPIIYQDKIWAPLHIDNNSLPLKLPKLEEVKIQDNQIEENFNLHQQLANQFFKEIKEKDGQVIATPLDRAKNWKVIKNSNGIFYRETNVMPQWAGSSWYYIRYLSPDNNLRFVDQEQEEYWLKNGVDLYIGGREHTNTHLLYARFWHKFLYDIKKVTNDEPFIKLRHQGYITAYAYKKKSGEYVDADKVSKKGDSYEYMGEKLEVSFGKMGKSLKNAISHTDLCKNYGTDAYRLHILYGAPLDITREFKASGILGMSRFLRRFWEFATKIINSTNLYKNHPDVKSNLDNSKITQELYLTVKEIEESIEKLKFNLGIAALIKLLNTARKEKYYDSEFLLLFVKLLHPYAPLITEEIWNLLGKQNPIVEFESFPNLSKINKEKFLTIENYITLIVQVNGKKRAIIKNVNSKTEEKELIALAKTSLNQNDENRSYIIKDVFIKNNIINFII